VFAVEGKGGEEKLKGWEDGKQECRDWQMCEDGEAMINGKGECLCGQGGNFQQFNKFPRPSYEGDERPPLTA